MTRNTDSFMFAVRKLRNMDTGQYWYLLNLYYWSLTLE